MVRQMRQTMLPITEHTERTGSETDSGRDST